MLHDGEFIRVADAAHVPPLLRGLYGYVTTPMNQEHPTVLLYTWTHTKVTCGMDVGDLIPAPPDEAARFRLAYERRDTKPYLALSQAAKDLAAAVRELEETLAAARAPIRGAVLWTFRSYEDALLFAGMPRPEDSLTAYGMTVWERFLRAQRAVNQRLADCIEA